MVSYGNVDKLKEMGFTDEQARGALANTNNDMEAAIAYLFEEPIEVEVEPPSDQLQQKQEESLLNTQGETTPPTSGDGMRSIDDKFYDDNEGKVAHEERTSGYLDDSSDKRSSSDSEGSQIADFESLSRGQKPPTIVLKRPGYLENYCIPLVCILSQIPAFVRLVTETLDLDLIYNPSWSSSEIVSCYVRQETEENSCEEFLVELQKYVGFLRGLSNRPYVMGTNLISNIPRTLKQSLSEEKVETVDEFSTKFYECFRDCYIQAGKSSNEYDHLLKSCVESFSEEVKNDIFTIDIDVEYRFRVLYQSFNELFWGEDYEMLGNISLCELSLVLTIQLIGDESEASRSPFQLNEFFYPGIYSDKYTHAIKEMNKERETISVTRSETSKNIMKLSVFEGKKIQPFLEQTMQYLNDKNIVNQELLTLNESLINSKNELSRRIEMLNEQYTLLDISRYENIVNYIASKGLELPEKFLLVGVVLTDHNFLYRVHDDDSWVHQKSIYSFRNELIDIDVSYHDFHFVQLLVMQYTLSNVKPLLLLYVKSSLWQEDFEIANEKLKRFFAQDNALIDNTSTEDLIEITPQE